jgi:exodeoxyribonuclease-5
LPRAAQILSEKFPFEPTKDQTRFFELAEQFVQSKTARSTLVLKGYAGTGKTSLVGVLVKVLPSFGFKVMLLAPTGRAAKVLAKYSRKSAYTLHKIIYKLNESPTGVRFELRKNYSRGTIFMVDEASMISGGSFRNSVLADLIEYVFQHSSNKLILIGDTAQLPPVGQTKSPALSPSYLAQEFDLVVSAIELNQVMRQSMDSGILKNANSLRLELNKPQPKAIFSLNEPGIFRMSGERLEDGLRYAYDKFGPGESIVICRSNRNAVSYNRHIRHALFFYEDELEAGDQIMVVKNNYFYKPEQSPMGFLANGEFAEVLNILKYEERYDFRFADIEIRLLDDPSRQTLVVKVILDTLHSTNPSLTDDQYRSLLEMVTKEYQSSAKGDELKSSLKNDPYLQALQIKFAYALTCHKSQGGQWKAIFLDRGFINSEQQDKDFLRWLYTGVTRATEELFLVNFDQGFFESSAGILQE